MFTQTHIHIGFNTANSYIYKRTQKRLKKAARHYMFSKIRFVLVWGFLVVFFLFFLKRTTQNLSAAHAKMQEAVARMTAF